MKKLGSFAALLCAMALSACGEAMIQDITAPAPSARVKFFHFGVNAPGVNFYANDAKVTAVSSTTGAELTTGVAYGGVGSGGFYSGVEPGSYTLTGKIAATTDKDLAISTVAATIEANKIYSFYMSGVYNTTAKTVEGFVVEDNFAAEIDYANASVRFVNAVSNSSPMTLYAFNTTTLVETAVGGDVAYKAGGTFATLANGTYDLRTRVAGSSTNVIVRTGVQFIAGKVYTIGARGTIAGTGTAVPFLDNTANR